jgi:hypothetical protein
MANVFSNRKAPGQPLLDLSNTATGVLIETLALSGSDLASSPWERACLMWLAHHDQAIWGHGIVGFDVDEMAWSRTEFAAQHAFVLRVIERTMQRHRWELLGYDPPRALDYLAGFQRVVEAYQVDVVEDGKDWQWEWWIKPILTLRCPRHGVYQHAHGCVVCNNEGYYTSSTAVLGWLTPTDDPDFQIGEILAQARAAVARVQTGTEAERQVVATALEARARWVEPGEQEGSPYAELARELRALRSTLQVALLDVERLSWAPELRMPRYERVW